MESQAALNEIAFLLEYDLAPRFKVQAFRRAASAIDGMTDAQLRERIADGRLSRTKGIGDRTFQVISQAVEGAVPDYLVALRDARPERPDSPLAAQLRGDLHTHTEWSDGTVPIAAMADAATALGREYIAITDHSPHLTVANGLSVERLQQQLSDIEAWNRSADGGVTLLRGIEVDILEDGTLDQTRDMLGRLDVVTASVHSKLRADAATMTARMLGAVRDPATNVLGHCTGRLVKGSRGTRPQSEFDAEKVFATCAAEGVAVEINSRPERQDPPDDLIAMALDAGCLFSIDSDAHAPGHLAFVALGAVRAEAAGVPADRVVTTWPLPRLRDWLESRRADSQPAL
ncbi:PHP domain-containing protein [Humibacter ginsengiterrae]